jgi:hypothetical protein
MQHVEHILVTVSTTPVGKLYAYWAVVSTFTPYLLCFADVNLACISLYACYCEHTDVDVACHMRQYEHQIHRTHGRRPACVCMFC